MAMPTRTAAWSPSGRSLAIVNKDQTLQVFDAEGALAWQHALAAATDPAAQHVKFLRFLDDNKLLRYPENQVLQRCSELEGNPRN